MVQFNLGNKWEKRNIQFVTSVNFFFASWQTEYSIFLIFDWRLKSPIQLTQSDREKNNVLLLSSRANWKKFCENTENILKNGIALQSFLSIRLSYEYLATFKRVYRKGKVLSKDMTKKYPPLPTYNSTSDCWWL